MPRRTVKPAVTVKPSPIHGKGIFAARSFRRNALIGIFEGTRTKRDGMHVLWVTDDDGSLFGVRVRNDLRYINHSEQPTAEAQGTELIALRDIKPGTEITMHYGDEWE